ncbi:MAG: nucleoside phosphorylase [Candidatus Aminicenantes bacterium]
MPNESIFKPDPLPGFSCRDLVIIPADVPSRLIQKTLRQCAASTQRMLFSRLFYFKSHAVLYGGIGAPAVTLVLEPLLVSGIQRIIFLGLAGSLTSRLAVKSAAVIDSALSEEGTSRHYFPDKHVFSSSPQLSSRIESLLERQQLPFTRASAVSTDAPYRETPDWIARQTAQGCELVDMEISAVFALSEYYGVQAAALMLVSDRLWGSRHQKHFHHLNGSIRSYFYPFIKNQENHDAP